jgi:predicted RNA binding protein YcfA (HicA-like mRNA interferase family)
MKLPRDISGHDLSVALRALGYVLTRHKGSHMRITTKQGGEHHEVIPAHNPIKTGTLSSILKSVAAHHCMEVGELIRTLDL